MKAPAALAGAALVVLAAGFAPPPARAGGEETTTFALSFAVAPWKGEPVADRTWVDERVRRANRVFEPANVAFRTSRVAELPGEHARLETRRDRHRLGAHVRDGVIDVFVVERLRDVDDPARFRQGVHWRSRMHPGTHYVVLADHAGPTTLAHELGHFFGNRRHSDTAGNIMSYERGDGPPFFDKPQLRRIRRYTRGYVRTGELEPLDD